MLYAVKIRSTGEVHPPTDNYETARIAAICLSNWNLACDIINADTEEILKGFDAYRSIFDKKNV